MKRIATAAMLAALAGLAACANEQTAEMAPAAAIDGGAVCNSSIADLVAALDGGAGNANQRTEAESELDEALEARDGGDWADCLDALEEAFEALEMDEAAEAVAKALAALGDGS
ncbi:MAG: hypothetical protein O2905_03075 [Proteobacteria bacterium]|nr:hypothetical protein [Pseudomonadota bacterium]